jgi:hypothetical protein
MVLSISAYRGICRALVRGEFGACLVNFPEHLERLSHLRDRRPHELFAFRHFADRAYQIQQGLKQQHVLLTVLSEPEEQACSDDHQSIDVHRTDCLVNFAACRLAISPEQEAVVGTFLHPDPLGNKPKHGGW